MTAAAPHLVQYQGSKRKLASEILRFLPKRINRLVEPFAGTAAISIAASQSNRSDKFLLNDINAPLVRMLELAVENPEKLVLEYSKIWNEQFVHEFGHVQHFYKIRNEFNEGEKTAGRFLYLLARCVKGAVRYGKDGKFNQSHDMRRHGTHPLTVEKNALAISSLLKGKTEFANCDYLELFERTRKGDLVYMDPPYQGVTGGRDGRYCSGVEFEEFSEALEILNKKGIDYAVSYDGQCEGKLYGFDLAASSGCTKILLQAGQSTQATLLGRKCITYEDLYLSKSISAKLN